MISLHIPQLYIPDTSFWGTHVLQSQIANNFNMVQCCITYQNEFKSMWFHKLQTLGNKVMNWLVEDIQASQKRICSMDFVTNSNDFFYDSGRKFPWWAANVWSAPSYSNLTEDGRGEGKRWQNRISSPLFLCLTSNWLMTY